MKTLALTGGIAAGKSTVAKMFVDLGAEVLDADSIAHSCYAPGTKLNEEILKHFGGHIKKTDGTIDRKALAAIVFQSAEAKQWLEARTHGTTRKIIADQIHELQKADNPLILVEAALHVETGLYREFDGLIVVHVDPKIQIQRLMTREGLNRERALALIALQIPVEEKRGHADWVINNSGTLTETQEQVEKLYERLTAG